MPYALIGGLAVSARTEPRFTRDIDLAVAIDTQAVDELDRGLMARGLTVDAILTADDSEQVAALRLHAGQVRVDLLFGVTGLEAEACTKAELLEVFPDVQVRVVTLPYLVVFKLVAIVHRRRRQDEADVEVLLDHATTEERAMVGSLVERVSGLYRTDVGEVQAAWRRLLSPW